MQVSVFSEDGAVVAALSGELDACSAAEVERLVELALPMSVGELVVDLTGVTLLDSVGLRVVQRLLTRGARARVRSPGAPGAARILAVLHCTAGTPAGTPAAV